MAAAALAALALMTAGCGTQVSAQTDTVPAASAETAADTMTLDTAEAASSDLFTDRDLEQEADLTGAVRYTVESGKNIEITGEGVYVLSGTAENVSVIVDADGEAKVQLVLDGLEITNESSPCIYVKSADKVFVTTTDSENALTVTGAFRADGDTNTDAVIFSKDDLVLNGRGTLDISSTENGISGKDDVKVTGGTVNIRATADGIEANDAIMVGGGTVNIATCKDGFHAEKDDDDTLGAIYITDGAVNIYAQDDAIHATTKLQIDGGKIRLKAAEGLEGTWVQVNDGEVYIEASDDGINAAHKSSAMTPTAEFNGGSVTIVMGSGDTDAVDSNGNLIITGGTLDITAQSAFDYDGTCQRTGGTLIVNGTETDTVQSQMMGGQKGRGNRGGRGW